MIYAIIGMILTSLGSVISKYISVNFDIYKSLFYQYLFISFYAFAFLLLSGTPFLNFDLKISGLFILIGFFGYSGIWALYKALKHLNNAIVMVIAFTYVFLSYFLNIFLIGDIEKFSNLKLVLSIVYFLLISLFLFERNEKKKIKINKYAVYAFITSVSWTIYYGINNFIIKNQIATPVQMIFYSEFFIFIYSIIFFSIFLFNNKINLKNELKLNKSQVISYLSVALFLFTGGLLFFIGYKYVSGNIVNFIGLFSVITTPILTFIFLKEKLNSKQIATIFLAFIVLVLFIL
ncbi:DMT family transporter [Candidatus Gracilibacteria bacterium]|nr:DMT family transporter [Candidatus Gracilibacteria bacterium]